MSSRSFVAAVVFVLGLFVVYPKPGSSQAAATRAMITVTSGTTCVQTVGGGAKPFPALSKSAGETIVWSGPNAATPVTVTFPTGKLPFHRGRFSSGQNSGAPIGSVGNHPFQSVVVGSGGSAVTCSNFQDMGVHVDN